MIKQGPMNWTCHEGDDVPINCHIISDFHPSITWVRLINHNFNVEKYLNAKEKEGLMYGESDRNKSIEIEEEMTPKPYYDQVVVNKSIGDGVYSFITLKVCLKIKLKE